LNIEMISKIISEWHRTWSEVGFKLNNPTETSNIRV